MNTDIRNTILNHLLALGSDEAEVAKTLMKLGIKGKGVYRESPIISYLKSKDIECDKYDVGYLNLDLMDGTPMISYYTECPVIWAFNMAFDRGRYPELHSNWQRTA